MRKIFFCFICISGVCNNALCQKPYSITALEKICAEAKTDESKINALNNLADLYFCFQLDKQGDSILKLEESISAISGNPNLKILALYSSSIDNISGLHNQQSFNSAIDFINNSLNYAKESGQEQLISLSYCNLSKLYLKKGDFSKALENANTAFITSLTTPNDSIKVIAAMQVGNCYQAKNESVLAYKFYTNALEKAEIFKNIPMQSDVLHCFSELYKSLNNIAQSKEYLIKSYTLNKAANNVEGLIKDNMDLARLTNEKSFLNEGLKYAEAIKSPKYILQIHRIFYGYYATVVANSDSTIHFINNNADINFYLKNQGEAFYNSKIGYAYQYASKPDSALSYFKKSEGVFDSSYDFSLMMSLYASMGECYKKLQQPKESIIYFKKALSLSSNAGTPISTAKYQKELSQLYETSGDYKMAVNYLKQYNLLQDSISKMASQKDIVLEEVNNAKKNHDKDILKQQTDHITHRNLQYMAITIFIGIAFFILLILGLFNISPLTIKIGGYIVFISLFEFIILLIEDLINKIAHDNHLYIWILKIGIIAILAPFQHYLEHTVVKFLYSQKLIKLKESFFLKKLRQQKKPLADAVVDSNISESN